MNVPISITSIASVSPLGASLNEAWDNYGQHGHLLKEIRLAETVVLGAPLPEVVQEEIEYFRLAESKYKHLDNSVLYAVYASRKAVELAGWRKNDNFGINIGSSRGATSLFEKYHQQYLKNLKTPASSSPTTTLGNISSWVAHDLQSTGPEISHSITCSTSLHALLNGIAWIKSGMTDKFLVGGSEAPLTAFTIAQMQALKIYSRALSNTDDKEQNMDYPCRAYDLDKRNNTMVLGEGASMACLERGVSSRTLAIVEGVGYATEPLEHSVSLSTNANCMQRAMQMALGTIYSNTIDAIVMHAPGTIKGDKSEFNAIQTVFGDTIPALTTNKWKIGHTLGASGMLSVEMAVLMLQHNSFIGVPYINYKNLPKQINRILVNAVGFGGNAVSILLKSSNSKR